MKDLFKFNFIKERCTFLRFEVILTDISPWVFDLCTAMYTTRIPGTYSPTIFRFYTVHFISPELFRGSELKQSPHPPLPSPFPIHISFILSTKKYRSVFNQSSQPTVHQSVLIHKRASTRPSIRLYS